MYNNPYLKTRVLNKFLSIYHTRFTHTMRRVSTENAYGHAEGPVTRGPAVGPPEESANFMSPPFQDSQLGYPIQHDAGTLNISDDHF